MPVTVPATVTAHDTLTVTVTATLWLLLRHCDCDTESSVFPILNVMSFPALPLSHVIVHCRSITGAAPGDSTPHAGITREAQGQHGHHGVITGASQGHHRGIRGASRDITGAS